MTRLLMELRPMVFAAAEAYKETGQEKYADMAGHLAAWFLGANDGGSNHVYQNQQVVVLMVLSAAWSGKYEFRCRIHH